MHKRIELAAYQAMSAMGMLEPPQGSLTHPDPYSFLTGDGCWLPALSSLTQDDAVDPETGEIIRRYDPDALAYHTHEGKASSPGHLLVMVQARTPHPKERGRGDHSTQVRPQPRSEPQRRHHRRHRSPGTLREVPPDATSVHRHRL